MSGYSLQKFLMSCGLEGVQQEQRWNRQPLQYHPQPPIAREGRNKMQEVWIVGHYPGPNKQLCPSDSVTVQMRQHMSTPMHMMFRALLPVCKAGGPQVTQK